MPEKNETPFDEIHELLALGQANKALTRLLDRTTGRLRAGYAWDKNHAWYCVGCAEFDLGNYQSAIKAFRRAYEADAGDVQCLIAIGNCYDALRKPRLAERTLRKALVIAPEGRSKATAICNLGNALFDQKRYGEARRFYQIVLRRRDDIGRVARKNMMNALHLERQRTKSSTG